MEKVNWHRVERYGWECPCGQFNEMDEDPTSQESVFCEDCNQEFEVGEEE